METMTHGDKDLLFKDLSARLPYGVKVQYYDNETKKLEAGTIVSCTIPIDETNKKYPTFITRRDLLIIQGNTIEDIKPYLFPLSSMTKEQKKELKDIIDQTIVLLTTRTRNEDYGIDQGKHHFDHTLELDWLNKNHFDYRGLIEKGLAIDATELNIY